MPNDAAPVGPVPIEGARGALRDLHIVVGWSSILVFLALGLFLESLHVLKWGPYLDVDVGTRRLLWTLAHAHGALLGLVHVLFGHTLGRLAASHRSGVASRCLLAATVLIPAGFFLGGAFLYGGAAGVGVVLVPAGGLLLFVAVLLTAHSCRGL